MVDWSSTDDSAAFIAPESNSAIPQRPQYPLPGLARNGILQDNLLTRPLRLSKPLKSPLWHQWQGTNAAAYLSSRFRFLREISHVGEAFEWLETISSHCGRKEA